MVAPSRSSAFLLVALSSLAACVDQPEFGTKSAAQLVPYDEPDDPSRGPPADDRGGGNSVCRPLTVTGKVFYNDLRKFGRFADRKTILPSIAGFAIPFGTTVANQNYLGLLDGKVNLYEVDQFYPLGSAGDCVEISFAGSTQIVSDGTWSWTGTVCDSCSTDLDGAYDNGVSIAAKIILEKCNVPGVRCFSVDDPQGEGVNNHYTDANHWGTTWSRWYHEATNTDPVGVHQQTTVDLGVDYFQRTYGLTAGYASDLDAQAANLFASMVDVTRRVHLDEYLAFDHDSLGRIRAYFPSVIGGNAHSHQADRLCVPAPATWLSGTEATHEYGHLIHYWAWGGVGKWGSHWFDSDGDGATADDEGKSSTTREFAITAFKEGWADFITRVTFDGANVGRACAAIENRTLVAPAFTLASGTRVCPVGGGTCIEGRFIQADVEQTLCDLWDPVETNVANVDNDRLQVSLLDMQANLTKVFFEANLTEQQDVITATSFGPTNTATASLGMCRFAEKLVASGTSASLLIETLAVNQLDCGL